MTAEHPPLPAERSRQAAVDRLHRRARTVIDGFSDDLPRYEHAATSMVEPEVVTGVHLNVDLFFRTLVTGRQPTDAEIAPIVEIAVQRHDDGVTVDEIVATYQSGADLIWAAVVADADSDETLVLLDSAASLMRYLVTVTSRIAAACGASRALSSDRDRARRAIAQALVEGIEPDAADARLVKPADRYRVAMIRTVGSSSGDLRAVADRLTTAVDGVLIAGHADGVVALLPARDDPGADAVSEMLRRAGDPVGVAARPNRFLAGISEPRPRRDIPDALRQARLVSELSILFGDGVGPAHVGDVLFAYLVATQTEVHSRLLAVVDALSTSPALADTVAAFLDCSGNQLAAARAVNVHRNTVSYRLMRATELSGHDPTTPHGREVHAAARIVAALRDAGQLDTR